MNTTKPPAVVIVARHGMRLDAADESWHMSTPTPYDPPLTYAGWNQCRALGVRVASLLHAREQSINASDVPQNAVNGPGGLKRKRRKHKVVVHSSPFLRCLQTSVAIAAGIAQFDPPKKRPESSTARLASTMYSASPRLRARDSPSSPSLAPINEPRDGFQRDLARRALGEQKPQCRKSKIRIDAWLGEWLNPQYFDHITPPPPSPMMVASAKAELMQDDSVDVFTPTVLSHKSSRNSLWSGARPMSSESTLEDWSHVTDALETPKLRRQRSTSASSFESNESGDRKSSSGRKSPFRPTLQRLTSIVAQPETAIYKPPTPSYAIAGSANIPKGYVTHAKTATCDVDYHWDSSRPPLDWGTGGELGEEWSAMHRRVRKGLNELVQWYSHHQAEDNAEDLLAPVHPEERWDDDEEEELVVILVTHAAGCNALIGALTQQPVLLDVGMASLTMAVRRDDAPALLSPSYPTSPRSPEGTPSHSPDPALMAGRQRRSSLDIGLSAVYDMKLVASSEHLRPGSDPTRPPVSFAQQHLRHAQDVLARYKQIGTASPGESDTAIETNMDLGEPHHRRSNTSRSLGSVRRPSTSSLPPRLANPSTKANSLPPDDRPYTPPTFTTGLWTPPSGRGTPLLSAQKVQEERRTIFSQLNDDGGRSSLSPVAIDYAQSPPESRPTSAHGQIDAVAAPEKTHKHHDSGIGETAGDDDHVGDLPSVSDKMPSSLSRGLSQKGLWGRVASGDRVARKFADAPKRRWTVNEHD